MPPQNPAKITANARLVSVMMAVDGRSLPAVIAQVVLMPEHFTNDAHVLLRAGVVEGIAHRARPLAVYPCSLAWRRSFRAKCRYVPTLNALITTATTFQRTTGRETINRP
jgi:hypothetical protein